MLFCSYNPTNKFRGETMNTTLQVYVSEKDFPFMAWAKKRFGRNFSRVVINSMKEYVGDEWTNAKKELGLLGDGE